ncbi:MAG: cytochrome c [Defluviicoccus sp.]|nr:cytochrome c [Defluviicoccus sp.]MDG4608123.1 cytochrome c [Defluviicoccus sp.]
MRVALSSLAVCAALLAAATAEADGFDAARKAYLTNLLTQDCGSCHGLTMKGGLGSPLLPQALADKADEVLVEAILDGRPGTPMPPWRFELSTEEAVWLVERLRQGSR